LAVDYDLVIIGNTRAARIAARAAMEWPARVALVLPPTAVAPYAHIYPYALQQASSQGFHRDPHYPWQYAKTVVDRVSLQLSIATLAAQGVDIVEGDGEFGIKPTLSFNIGQRRLRAKNYLLAMGSQIEVPEQIPGLATTGFLSLATLAEIVNRPKIPSRWAIIGDEAIGVEMAQALRKLGYEVLLVIESSHILPEEDPDAAAAVQFQLEASGIVLMTQKTIQEVGVDDHGKYLTIDRRKYHIDEILVAATEQPCVESFGLGGARVEYDRSGVGVDEQLQTSNHRIYACGSVCGKVLGGYYGEHLAEYEARLAVHNAMSGRKKPVNYHKIPWTIFSHPQIARVGPTELDARLQYKKRLMVLRRESHQSPRALVVENDHGFVKLIVRRSGRIIGATIVGRDAAEMAQIVALAIRHQLRVDRLSDFPGIALTNTHSIVEAARQWQPPSRWLQAIDPMLQGLSELGRSIGGFFSRLRPRHRSKLKS
jgi:pyruvate/2-oxoglutarate dehydrogenase complex dihydrolipoamide dehydrogenase (E3) component